MNTNHTPLPWHYGIASECIITPKGEEIASLASSDLSEKEDNARLIAQAPALLAALEGLVKQMMQQPEIVRGDYTEDTSNAISTARAVIAQAKGETR